MKSTDPGYKNMLRDFLAFKCHEWLRCRECRERNRISLITLWKWNVGTLQHCEANGCPHRSIDYYCTHPEHPRNISLETVVFDEL